MKLEGLFQMNFLLFHDWLDGFEISLALIQLSHHLFFLLTAVSHIGCVIFQRLELLLQTLVRVLQALVFSYQLVAMFYVAVKKRKVTWLLLTSSTSHL